MDLNDDEIIARCVFSPRNVDPLTHRLKENFIFLREGENDISFVRYGIVGKEQCISYAQNIMRKQQLYAFAIARVGDIRGISDRITVTADSEVNPLHASVRILIDDEPIKGIVTSAEVQDLFDQILEVLKIETV